MRRTEALPSRLYAITDRRLCAPQPLAEVVRELLDAGVRFLQVREKDLRPEELQTLADPIVRLCHDYDARALINACPEAATAVGADGVHLPGAAGPVEKIRAVSGRPWLVGCSTHDAEEVRKREAQGADFVVFGPVHPTDSKPGYGPAQGPAGLRRIVESVELPVFALGGVSPDRVKACLDAGAFGVAVMSGLMRAGRRERVRAYLRELGE